MDTEITRSLNAVDEPTNSGQGLINILLWLVHVLFAGLIILGRSILNTFRQDLDGYKTRMGLLEKAHTELVLQQTNFVTRDDLEEYLDKLEERLGARVEDLHEINTDKFETVIKAIGKSGDDTRTDIGRIHSRIDGLLGISSKNRDGRS